jgi:hypothetical protein
MPVENESQLVAFLVVVCLSIVVSLGALIYYRNTDAHEHFKESIKFMTYEYLRAEDCKKEGLSNLM